MQLFERIFQKAHQKLYYHGSPTYFTNIERRIDPFDKRYGGDGAFFITMNKIFACFYGWTQRCNFESDGLTRLYTIVFTKQPNVFSSNNPVELEELRVFLHEKYGENEVKFLNNLDLPGSWLSLENGKIIDKYIKKLASQRRHWEYVEPEPILTALKELGYDAFATREQKSANYGVFNPEILKIVKIEELDEEQLKALDTTKEYW
jgi:hypothetical protein